MAEEISVNSTKEEIANFFRNNFNISEQAKNNIIKEDISGDILLDITKQKFSSLGIKLGPFLKIDEYLTRNKEKFKPKEIKEKITVKSSSKEVKKFFEESLGFKGDLNGLDGKGLIDLEQNEEGIKKLGLSLGKELKLKKYIKHFKTLKEDEDLTINEFSTEEEINQFLRMKSKLSQDSIDEIGLDYESILLFFE